MLSLGSATRLYLVSGATDMRKSFNGLYGIVKSQLKADPLCGHAFLFCNRRRNRLKVLFWDGSGLWVCAKRIEKGTFRWPETPHPSMELTREEVALLVGGIDLDAARHRRWYRREHHDLDGRPSKSKNVFSSSR